MAEEETERQYVIDEQAGQERTRSDRDYVSKIGDTVAGGLEKLMGFWEYASETEATVSDVLGVPDAVPLYQMRARLIEEQDMSYDEETDAVIYEVSEDSQTVYSLENISDTDYLRHIREHERVDMTRKERNDRANTERSLAVLTAIGTAMDEYDTDRIIIKTDHGWNREIDGEETERPEEEAYQDVRRYIETRHDRNE